MKKVVVFDLDGTLLDTLKDLATAVNYALDHFSYPNRTLEQVRKDIGNGVNKLIERSIPNGLANKDYDACLSIFKKYYRNNYDVYTKSYETMPELVKEIKDNGYIVTVATNKIIDVAKILLNHHYPGLFDYIQGDDVGIKKKPDPNMIDNIVRHYEVTKDEVLYIGDTNVDEETALNSGVDYILVTYGYRTEEEIKNSCTSKNLAHDKEEILNYLLNWS